MKYSQSMLVLAVVLGVGLVAAKSVHFKDCGSSVGKIVSIDVTPCDNEPCVLHKPSNVTVTITFVPSQDIAAGTSVVHGVIAGLPVPFPLPDADLCKFTKPGCTLKAGQQYVYTNVLAVKSIYPSIQLVVKWELVDKTSNKDIVCGMLPAMLK